MPDPKPDPIRIVEAQITDALAELREARTCLEHSPNSDTEYWAEQAETRLGLLMDKRKRLRTAADQLVSQ